MALQLDYNGNLNAYLKAVPTTIHEEYVDDVKTFYTLLQYYIYDIKGGNILFVDSMMIQFDPDISIYKQIYTMLNDKFPTAYSI